MSMKACVFAGQGAQVPGMGRDFAADAEIAALFTRANAVLGFDLAKICFEGPAEELTKSNICQPAIFTVSVAAFQAFRKRCPQAEFASASANGPRYMSRGCSTSSPRSQSLKRAGASCSRRATSRPAA